MKSRFPWMLSALCVLAAPAVVCTTNLASASGIQPLDGRVSSLKYTQIVIRSDQDRELALIIDSHTLIPPDLAAGVPVRIEYSRTHDGRYHAERVVPFRRDLLPPGTEERSYLPDAAMAWMGRWQVTRLAGAIRGSDDTRAREAGPWHVTLPTAPYANIEDWNPFAVLVGLLLSACILLARSWRPRTRAHG